MKHSEKKRCKRAQQGVEINKMLKPTSPSSIRTQCPAVCRRMPYTASKINGNCLKSIPVGILVVQVIIIIIASLLGFFSLSLFSPLVCLSSVGCACAFRWTTMRMGMFQVAAAVDTAKAKLNMNNKFRIQASSLLAVEKLTRKKTISPSLPPILFCTGIGHWRRHSPRERIAA